MSLLISEISKNVATFILLTSTHSPTLMLLFYKGLPFMFPTIPTDRLFIHYVFMKH